LSGVLRDLKYCDVMAKTIMAGMIGFHRGVKVKP